MSIVSSKISDLLAPKAEPPKSRDIASREEFLQLLVTQLKNQNPLDPMNPEDFSAQLAQFSSLEKLISIDSTLEKNQEGNLLLTQMIGNSIATNLIGRSVMAAGDTVNHISGNSEMIGFTLEKDAENVVIHIKDVNGLVIRKIVKENLKEGENWIEWDGKNMDGVPASNGFYAINITAKDDQNNDIGVEQYMMGRVEGVRFVDGRAYLIVNGNAVDISRVSEVFE